MAYKILDLAMPPELLQLKVGDTCHVIVYFDYVGPAISGTIHVAIGRVGIFGFDEIVYKEMPISIPDTPNTITYQTYADVYISSAMKVAPGYDVYAKIMNIPPGAEAFSPIYYNIIEII